VQGRGRGKSKREDDMPRYTLDEVRGYRVKDVEICKECITREEMMAIRSSDLMMSRDLEAGTLYCQRCGEEL